MIGKLLDQIESVQSFSRWWRWSFPLLLLLVSCGGSLSGSPVPAEMRGQWEAILTYVPPYYEGRVGGSYQGDGFLGIALYFWPDGRYQHTWNLVQSYYGGNCFRTAGWKEFGTVRIVGDDYTFIPTKATYSLMDSCGGTKYLDPAPVKPATRTVRLGQDNTGWPVLHFSLSPSEELVLEKCRTCK